MTTDPTRPVPRDIRHSQERTIGQLFAQVTDDLSIIVRKEIELAKTELSSQLGIAGKGAGLLAGAGVVALYALGLLFITLSLVIAIWLPVWAGFLIITVVLFVVAAILAMIGRKALQEANLKPERAIASSQETIAAVKGSALLGSEHAKAVPAANAQVALDERPPLRELHLQSRGSPRVVSVTSHGADAASVLIDGPWHHRLVSANGARFHVAEMGDGPMVLLMHGFPQFWYTWRHQMAAIADAGWRAVAMDLRGYGASDKPPRGYSTYTGAEDAASVIRSLGEDDAIVLGQGLGGFIAWCMPSLQPGVTRAVGSLSMPHPRVMRRASFLDARQRRASRYLVELQRPFGPERAMTRDHAYVEEVLRAWSSPYGDFPTPDEVRRYGEAMALPFVAHSAAEHYRWFGRSQVRQDGPLFNRRIRGPISQPVLHLQGTEDGCVLAACTGGSEDYVTGPYAFQLVDGAGHFLTEEAPARVSGAIVDWLDSVDA